MADTLTPVLCRQSDCCFYQTFDQSPGKVYCRHAEKIHYMDRNPCPLYRMDWQKKGGAEMTANNASQFLKMVKKPIR